MLISMSKPKLQSNQIVEEHEGVGYTITTNYGNGNIGKASFDKKGNFVGGGVAQCPNSSTR